MPNSLQYPLELEPNLLLRWGRLLQPSAAATSAPLSVHIGAHGGASPVLPEPLALLVHTMPARDQHDDHEEDEDREESEGEDDDDDENEDEDEDEDEDEENEDEDDEPDEDDEEGEEDEEGDDD